MYCVSSDSPLVVTRGTLIFTQLVREESATYMASRLSGTATVNDMDTGAVTGGSVKLVCI